MSSRTLHHPKSKISIQEELENYRNEVGVLRRTVESKSAAIAILHSELKECQQERDEFRTIAETKPMEISQTCPMESVKPVTPEKNNSAILSGSECTLAQLLSQSKEENKQLKLQMTDTRCRLHDALSDLKVLREEKSVKTDIQRSRLSAMTSSQLAQQERETLLHQLEELSSKCQALESDLHCLLEEREELITERDETRHKLHRLNHILNVLLSQNEDAGIAKKRVIDIDAIITENRYLQQRLKQLKEEKSLADSNAARYKSVLEKCQTNHSGGGKAGQSENIVITSKQVAELLKQYGGNDGDCAADDLKSLCVALLDSVNQKSRVVKSQRVANKMLAGRIEELEKILMPSVKKKDSEHESTSTLVSATLMNNYKTPSGPYVNSDVDEQKLSLLIKSDKKFSQSSSVITTSSELDTSPVTIESDNSISTSEENNSSRENVASCIEIADSVGILTEKSTVNESITPRLPLSICQQNTDKNSETLKNSPKKERTLSTESDLEEVIEVENLDSYIMNLKQKRMMQGRDDDQHHREKQLITNSITSEDMSKKPEETAGTFDMEISDYESDDENLEETLQNWQSEFERSHCSKIVAHLSPRKSKASNLWKQKRDSVEIPSDLQDILN